MEIEGNRYPGNYQAILDLLSDHDTRLQQKIGKLPKNAHYRSPEIQNELLSVMGSLVRNKICEEVRNSGHFTLMVDETRDVSKKEQVSIVVKDVEASAVYENFLTYVTAPDIPAEGLSTLVTNTLSQHNLPLSMCVCQSYDGAAVMSGRLSGVQGRIRKLCSQAIYMHCFAHRLNLVLVDCSKNVEFVSEFFSVHQILYLFLSSSAVLPVFEEVQSVAGIKKPLRIKSLSNTRWACPLMLYLEFCNHSKK